MEFDSKKGWLVVILLTHTFVVLLATSLIAFEATGESLGMKIGIDKLAPYLLAISAVLGTITLKIAIEIVKLLEIETKACLQQEKLKNMEEFNLALREQRHDFLNHLQVVSGFIQINKHDKAKEYLLSLSENLLIGDGKGFSLDSEVGMLIYSKKIKAERHQILWQHKLELNLDMLAIPRLEMVRILGNILDNALYELERVPVDKRKLDLEISKLQEAAVIKVTNYGTVIDDNIVQHVFKPGFTTKEAKGDGMGLYIVRALVEKWNGSVCITSNKEEMWTRVIITCPLKNSKQANSNFSWQEFKEDNFA